MKKVRKRFVRILWYCCLVGVIALGLIFVVGCSSSDDDGGGGPDTLSLYNFTLDMDPDEVNGVLAAPQAEQFKPGPVEVSWSEGEDSYRLKLSGQIRGSLDRTDNTYTVNDDTEVWVEDFSDPDPFVGNLEIDVTADFVIPEDDPPTSGSLTVWSPISVFQGASFPQDVVMYEEITVTVGIDPVDGPGVTITTDDGPATEFLTWQELADLGDEDPLWQLKGAFGLDSFDFLLERSQFVTTVFDRIDDLEGQGALVDGVAVVNSCSEFPDGNVPEGLPPQGTNEFTWYDVTTDGDVGPGDDFDWYFYNCWDNDPGDSIDDLYNGGMNLFGYTAVENDNGTLIRIGFEPYGGDPGGVHFDEFLATEIRDDGGTYSHDEEGAATLNGGFTIVFYEPEDDV